MVGFAKVREGEKVICKTEKVVLGFSAKVEKSQIIYLPFYRNVLDKNELKEGFQSLIDSLLTFISVSQTDIPFWAKENPFFTEEKSLLKEKEVLQKKLAEKVTELEIFDKAKSLLFCREYTLENFLINFLISELDLKIYRKETFDADFWLVDKNDEKIAIAEIKSAVKGFKKAMIYKLLNHRHDYEKPDDFPSLLFVNCNLQAGKWSDKDRPINAEDYREAARNNVLVIRVEDVVRLWQMKRLGEINKEKILEKFLTEKGWLQVSANLEIQVKPK